MILGITGLIGSGKTTVAKLFSKHWFNRIDADEIGHKLMQKNSVAYKKIIQTFGNQILDKIGNIDRKKLGDLVFGDNKKIQKLNSIMHPIIIKEIKNQIKKIQEKCDSKTRIVLDAPLLLETETKNLVDKTIVVKTGIRKIFARSKNFSKEQIERILNAQMSLSEKLKQADFVIDNNKDLKHLEKQIENIIKKI